MPVLPDDSQGGLEMEIPSLVGYFPVEPSQMAAGLLPVVGTFRFAGESLIGLPDLFQRLLERFGCYHLAAVTEGQEGFQAEVATRYFGSRGVASDLMFGISDKNEVDIAQGIPFDGQGFDLPEQFTGLKETVLLPGNDDAAEGVNGITGLFQSEAAVFLPLLERWRSDFPAGSGFQVLKEKLIGFLDALHHVLNGLGAEIVPELIPGQLFQPGEMLHQPELVEMFPEPSVVPLMQGDTVVPHRSGNFNLPM